MLCVRKKVFYHEGYTKVTRRYTEKTRRFTEGRGKVNLMLGFTSVVLCEILSDTLCKKKGILPRRFTERRGKVNLMLGFTSVVLCEILSDALCKKKGYFVTKVTRRLHGGAQRRHGGSRSFLRI